MKGSDAPPVLLPKASGTFPPSGPDALGMGGVSNKSEVFRPDDAPIARLPPNRLPVQRFVPDMLDRVGR